MSISIDKARKLVRKGIREVLGTNDIDKVGDQDDLFDPQKGIGDMAALDSLDRVELMMILEEETGLDLPDTDEDALRLRTIDDFATFVVGATA